MSIVQGPTGEFPFVPTKGKLLSVSLLGQCPKTRLSSPAGCSILREGSYQPPLFLAVAQDSLSRIVNSVEGWEIESRSISRIVVEVGRHLHSQPQCVEPPPLLLQVLTKGPWVRLPVQGARGLVSFQLSRKLPRKNSGALPLTSSFFITVFLLSFNIFLPIANCSLQTLIVENLGNTEKLKKSEITQNPTTQR